MRQVLRDYQEDGVSNLRAEVARLMSETPIDRHVGVILVAPTGSGKTTIASHIIESASSKGMNTLFLAHRKELIEQASARLDEHDLDHGIIKAGNKRINNLPVQVASVQTIVRRLKKLFKPFNLIVVDECHRTAAKSYLKVLGAYPGAVVIGLTATPYRTDGRGLGGIYQSIVEVSNPQTLTEQGFLVPTRIFTTPMGPDLKGVKIKAGDYDKQELNNRVNKPELIGDIYEHWNKHAKDRSTVVFASSRLHAESIDRLFKEHGVASEYLDGNTPEKERGAILHRLSDGKTKVCVNVGVLTEGWDCPCVSCVVLARPTKSTGLYLQMAGRALRPFPGKRDCVILDHGGNTHAHGLVTDPRFFTLDAKKKTQVGKVQPVKTCPKCFAVFRGTKCPGCGFVPAVSAQREGPEEKAGNLVEFEKSKKKIQEDYYRQLVQVQINQGYKPKWAAVQFKLKFGHWPPFRLTGNVWRARRHA